MAVAQLDILNGALALLGEEQVSAVDISTKAGKTFQALWDNNILAPVVALFPWIGLKKSAYLSAPSVSITGGSLSGTTITLTLSAWPSTGLSPSQSVTVSGVSPSDWNGSYEITAVDEVNKTISYTSGVTDTFVSGGTLTWSPLMDFTNIFSLPSDCARALRINEMLVSTYYEYSGWEYFAIGDTMLPFAIRGDYLLCDQSTVDLLYISYDNVAYTPPQDPIIVNLLTLSTAAALAFPLTRDFNIKKQCGDDFKLAYLRAKNINATQGTPEQFQESTWITQRY